MISGDGRTFQIEQYNQNHPDKQIAIEYTSNMDISNQYYEWLTTGKYDVALMNDSGWEKNVVAEDGTAAKLSEEFYGKNIFEEYTFEQGW